MRCNKCGGFMCATGDEHYSHAGVYETYRCEECQRTESRIIILYS